MVSRMTLDYVGLRTQPGFETRFAGRTLKICLARPEHKGRVELLLSILLASL